MKAVKNGVYETNKMRVEIGKEVVSKIFKPTRNSSLRYNREKKSLQRLSGLAHFPRLISFNDKTKLIKMSSLPGTRPEKLSEQQIELLRTMMTDMLAMGVARHALPIRDLLAEDEQKLEMVDFERVTIKHFQYSIIWLIAKKVSYYHLYRLIHQYQPQLLSESEKQFLSKVDKIRTVLQVIKPLRHPVRLLSK